MRYCYLLQRKVKESEEIYVSTSGNVYKNYYIMLLWKSSISYLLNYINERF